MRTIIVVLSLIASISMNTHGQNFFSIVPDFGGDEMEGMAYNIIPLKDDIKVIGLVHDSIVSGFEGGNWPILGSISYNGEYLSTQYLTDSLYPDGFRYFTRRIAFKNDSICYLYDRRDLGGIFYDAYLAELNYREGRILRSKIIYDEITSNEDFVAQTITVGENGKLYLINITTENGIFPQILTVLDSTFNMLSQSLIPHFGRKNYAKYIEEDSDGNITMVGVSLGDPAPVWWESKLYKQVLDSNLMSVEFMLAPTEFAQSIILTDAYTVIKNRDGEWIIASQIVIETPDCEGCWNGIPYVTCISSYFNEVLWETRMFDGDEYSSVPLYWMNGITEVADGYIFAGSRGGERGIETTGVMGKVGLDGDSLWLKYYIPVGWDTTQALWFNLKDIKTTPEGNVVAAGRAYDTYNGIRVPWILHLDPDGCLDPGCNPSSSFGELDDFDGDMQIFPNPARMHCSIRVQIRGPSQDYKLKIFDSQGGFVRNLNVVSGEVQYILDLHDWPAGAFFVHLSDQAGRQLTRKFVVLD